MRILFENARILSMNDRPIVEGDLVVDGNHVVYIGKNGSKHGPFDRVILCDGNVLMPGFKNAHNHSAMTFLRSYADDLSLRDWLYNWVFPIEAKLQPTDVYHLSKLAFAEYLTSGITANFDMYYFPKEIARAASDFGMRTIILGTPTKFKESISDLRENYQVINGKSDIVSFRLGFHAEYTATHEMLVQLSELANELKAPVFTHISETENEVQGCIDRHGDTPAVYFEKLGLFNYGGGGFHGVYLTDEDMEVFKRRNLHLVTCPSSNTKLASGIAPVQKFLDYGMNLSIGTDGPASNNCLDFFREMFLVTGLAKLKTMDPTSLDGYQVLKMATVGGAKALGLDDADTLEVGKLADLIMIDLKRPNMQPLNNIEKNLVYSGSKENVKLTMINGKILYEDGKFFLDEPIEQIYKNAQQITDRIKQEITK
ncbi:MAG: amidohydrolase [Bacilli bacterium]|jgi:5-methylthioadenosine/S-adenosylhomocysteine deaminase|nr:amidohydrolase [Bacilli bacterium]